ncbi:hypothetical protein C8Q80DRAFT_625607 [Daedaleopsis nitida]|nr:hypothetical protein C8Q80DRAFT_625607 [Daedaleopsis nitida]
MTLADARRACISIAMPSRVPVEVAERIIDQLANDRDALLACALTSPAWLTRSRAHLFRTVRISSLAQLYSLHRRLLHNSTLGRLITAVIAYRVTVPNEVFALDAQTGAIENAAVILLPHLPNLQSWTYESVRHHSLFYKNNRVLRACHRQHSTVHQLQVYNMAFKTIADLARLLLAFPALRTLEAIGVSILRQEDMLPTWLASRLQNLRLLELRWDVISVVGTRLLVWMFDASVQYLTIGVEYDDFGNIEYRSSPEFLASFRNLRSIRIAPSASAFDRLLCRRPSQRRRPIHSYAARD